MLPIIFDAKEQDCSAAGPNHEIKMCEIGPRASYKMTHCICLGDPKDPLMVQTSFFAIPKIGSLWSVATLASPLFSATTLAPSLQGVTSKFTLVKDD